jgi:hypothetical protein
MAETYKVSHLHAPNYPLCIKCNKPMLLLSEELQYSGYSRRMFGCQLCDGTMTEWSGSPERIFALTNPEAFWKRIGAANVFTLRILSRF